MQRFANTVVLVLFILANTTSGALAALNGQISGTVRDAETKAPLVGVAVTAVSPSGRYSSATDAHGYFHMVGVIPDTYTLSYSKQGYNSGSLAGVTVLADSAAVADITLSKALKTIARVTARRASSAFQPGQTEDSYSIGTADIDTVQGKAYNTNEKSLLQSFPSVTVDKTGTVEIRGGLSFQTGYQTEGIDYTEPNKNLQNPFGNVGNFNLLNGIGAAQLIPGGGDATHGNTGTGLVSFRAKRGTYPGFGSIDLEADLYPYYHQYGLEYGIATKNNRFSNYFSYLGTNQVFQYGGAGSVGNQIGIFQGASPYGVYNTAANQRSDDFLDNFFYHFGSHQQRAIQLFYQSQYVNQGTNYNGFSTLCYSSCAGIYNGYLVSLNVDQNVGVLKPGIEQQILPLYPNQTQFNAFLPQQDFITNPFSALKVEFSNNVSASTFYTVRAYQTLNNQIETQAGTGIYIPDNGGRRTGASGEFSYVASDKHLLEAGGKYEFTKPFGTLEDVSDYSNAFFDQGIPLSPVQIPGNFMAADFIPASLCSVNGYQLTSANTDLPPAGGYGTVPCGYLSKYFPNGIPRIPGEVDVPVASQQVYGWFVQDTYTYKKVKMQTGLRLDGFNFLFPNDPLNPPTIAAVAHQRLFEPHFGITYRLTPSDFIRATYGRTLAIPLVGLFGNNIDRASLAAFNNIPSFDNSTGTVAMYCGVNLNLVCANYADQLYWVLRDAKFGANQTLAALKGATFTNYDFTYSHQFKHGVALSITPFFRRGYDIVEASSTQIGTNQATGLPLLGPLLYSNNGIQKATGAELLITKENNNPEGFSGQLSATYVNQLGNDPPGSFLPTASLELGNLYRSANFSPFQTVLALTYKTGWMRFNPVISYNIGYPYGLGTITQNFINGVPYNLPNTNIAFLVDPNNLINTPPALYVDPQNPGSRLNPNVIGSNGLPGGAAAGSLLSAPEWNVDFTFQIEPPNSRATYGLAITNLFNQLYSIPTTNFRYIYPITTGVGGPGTGNKPPNAVPNDQSPNLFAANAFPYSPYLILPNRPGLAIRTYVQIKI